MALNEESLGGKVEEVKAVKEVEEIGEEEAEKSTIRTALTVATDKSRSLPRQGGVGMTGVRDQ